MKFRITATLFVLCILFLLLTPMCNAQGQNPTQYTVRIQTDGSATWTITQVSDINGTIDTWDGFQQKVFTIIDASISQTQREMDVYLDSLQMNTIISWETQSKITEYVFTWQNFSITQNGKMAFGDVFSVNGFFSYLYGDGVLQITYPSTYAIQSVSPAPNEHDDSTQTIKWLGSQYFINGNPNIILTNNPQTGNNNGRPQSLTVAIVVTLTIVFSLVGFYFVRRRKRHNRESNVTTNFGAPKVESEEEKILKVIQSSGGSAFQSAITEKCRFSKAKTSQLLTALEKKGVVRRYKKGRDKIVTLTERVKGEKS